MKKLFLLSAGLAALIAAPATAADMPVKAPVYRAPPSVAVYSWTGFYVGANIGYSWGRSSNDWNFFAPNESGVTVCTSPPVQGAFCATGSGSNKLNGVIGGLQAGYNWQTANFLAGIETDIQISGQKGDDNFINVVVPTAQAGVNGFLTLNQSEKLQWLGTLRGRAGLTFDRWLVYGTGGLAYGGVKIEETATATGAPNGGVFIFTCLANGCPFQPLSTGSSTRVKAGWTVGAGIEGAISNNWTVKVEYLYVDLGSVDATFATLPGCYGNLSGAGACASVVAGSATIRARVTDNIVRFGLNYKFDWGGPVVASY